MEVGLIGAPGAHVPSPAMEAVRVAVDCATIPCQNGVGLTATWLMRKRLRLATRSLVHVSSKVHWIVIGQ